MIAWLLAHASGVLSTTLLVGLGCAAITEGLAPRRSFSLPPGPRWGQQFGLTALGFLLSRCCLPVSALAVAAWARQEHWGLFNAIEMPLWLQIPCGLLVLDLGSYVVHRLSHALPLLWRIHQVHHSDVDVDCGTAFRHHPVEALISQGSQLALIAAFGVDPMAVLAVLVIGTVWDLFSHANVALPARAEHVLRRFLVTPDLHRIHHSADAVEGNRNFASLISGWDRLFSTYLDAPHEGQERMRLGLTDRREPAELSLLKLLILPLRPLRVPDRPAAGSGGATLSRHVFSR